MIPATATDYENHANSNIVEHLSPSFPISSNGREEDGLIQAGKFTQLQSLIEIGVIAIRIEMDRTGWKKFMSVLDTNH